MLNTRQGQRQGITQPQQKQSRHQGQQAYGSMGWDDEIESPVRSRLQPAQQAVSEETITRNVVDFHEVLNSIAKALSTPSAKMTDRAQQKLRTDRENAKNLAKSIHVQLKSASAIPRQRLDKLERDFNNDMKRYDQLMKQTIARDREEINVRKQSMGHDYLESGGSYNQAPQRQQQQSISFSQSQLVTEEALIREKNDEIRAIEQDLFEVNQLMKDVSVLVNEQQSAIDSIEANVEATAVHVTKGNEQLRKAGEHQKTSRKRMCCLAILLLLIIIILGVVFGVIKK